MIDRGRSYSFNELAAQVLFFQGQMAEHIPPGSVAGAMTDYSFQGVALFLALARNRNIIVPLSKDSLQKHDDFMEIAGVSVVAGIDENNQIFIRERNAASFNNDLYRQLRSMGNAGLVLFSSGSSGSPKGIVHNLDRLAGAYKAGGKSWRTLIFLQMDHIGGVNTLLYSLWNGGVLVIPESRMPEEVCQCIQNNQGELLPTSPTFLNLLILSNMINRYDLSSLKLITYGTEPMQEITLKRIQSLLPRVRFKQTYGLSETGILQTKSREDGTLWVKVGGNGFDVRIKDGRLWIKSAYSMLGYLNAVSPFEDGYIDTGDMVERNGDWLKILGRESELINVGGNKVFPVEVESVLQSMPEVEDVVVYGASNPLTGQMVAAVVKLEATVSLSEFKSAMRIFCKERLESYKIPVKVLLSEESLHSERFKKKRNMTGEERC